MIKFLGLLSKKKKIRALDLAPIYFTAIENVVSKGFLEMSDFINQNNNFERSPGLTESDIDWFRDVVFLANLSNLSSFFEEDEVTILRAFILEYRYKDISINEQNLSMETFLEYEKYFNDLMSKHENLYKSMSYAIFEKYFLNDFQGSLFRKKNKPNPVFINELKNLLQHFIWNWSEYLQKNKVIFK